MVTNAQIDLYESASGHFAAGLNVYKLLWICFIGSFIGVVIETVWCRITNGYIESRAGLVYGPFNLLYGAGAVAMTVCLYAFRNSGAWISFFGGMIVGSMVEYICSFLQEAMFGSRSWDYSGMPLHVNGRICLLYSFFWGALGVLWIKVLYPLFARGLLLLPNTPGRILTVLLTLFFVWNACVTTLAVARWARRTQGRPPQNAVEVRMDERFPDARMQKIFANMDFSKSHSKR